MTLRTLDYGTYGIFLILGHAGFWPSTVVVLSKPPSLHPSYPLNPNPSSKKLSTGLIGGDVSIRNLVKTQPFD